MAVFVCFYFTKNILQKYVKYEKKRLPAKRQKKSKQNIYLFLADLTHSSFSSKITNLFFWHTLGIYQHIHTKRNYIKNYFGRKELKEKKLYTNNWTRRSMNLHLYLLRLFVHFFCIYRVILSFPSKKYYYGINKTFCFFPSVLFLIFVHILCDVSVCRF